MCFVFKQDCHGFEKITFDRVFTLEKLLLILLLFLFLLLRQSVHFGESSSASSSSIIITSNNLILRKMLHFCNILMSFQIMVFVMSVDPLCAVVLPHINECDGAEK